jgi:hypothetical protein
MLSPPPVRGLASTTRHASGSPTQRPRRWLCRWTRWLPRTTRGRALAMLAVSLVVLLGGTLAIAAAPSQATPVPELAAAQPAPPFPTMDEREPGSLLPACTLSPTTTPTPSVPTPTNELPVPTPTVPAPPPPTDCVPGQLGCQPPTTPPPTTTPCVGEDCIPFPTTSAPGSGAPDQEPGEQVEDPDCGITDITGCVAAGINSVFRGLVQAALSPILDLLAATTLSTPTIDAIPGIGDLWHNSFGIVLAAYGLLILIGGIVVMSHESLQTRYSIKEIGPRIPVAFLASTLSLFFIDKLIRLANAFSTAILGADLNPPSLGDTLNQATAGALTGGLFLILTALVLVVVGIGLLIVYVIRVMITVVLIISGPLFLMFHALPHTDALAQWWWKATTAVLAIQVAQSLVLIVAVKTLLSGGIYLFTSFGAFGSMIGAIGLFIVLFKIPFWLFAAIRVGSGRSLIGGLARAYVAAKTFGMIAGRSGGGGGRGARSSGGGGHGGRGAPRGGGAGARDPYARTRSTTDGQYLLPLTGVRRTRPTTARTGQPRPAPAPKPRTAQGRQQALPLGDDWPENKPVLGRDGQYRLPLDLQRVTPPPPSMPPPRGGPDTGGRSRARSRSGQQLELLFDPYKGNRPNRSGQYPLPLDGVRRRQGTPRPPSPPPTPTTPPPRRRATQPELPFDPYKGNRANRSGQYPLPLEGVRRVPPPKPSAPSPASPPARPAPRAGRQLRLPLDLPTPPRRTPPPPSSTSGGKP